MRHVLETVHAPLAKDRNKQRKVCFSADTLDWLAKYLEILRGTVALALGGQG